MVTNNSLPKYIHMRIRNIYFGNKLFRSLRRHPPPERAQQLPLHSEGIRLLSEGEVVNIHRELY